VARRSFPGALRVLVPTVVAGFFASRAAPWVVSRVKPLVDAGRSQFQRATRKPGGRERSLEELT
jgi:hypothetical protein